MGLWGYNKLPLWKNQQKQQDGIVATDKGFEDARTGEVLVAIQNLSAVEGPAVVASVTFDKASYAQGDTINVLVTFTERAIVHVPVNLTITSTGVSGNFVVTAPAFNALSGQNVYTFTATVPAETAVLSIATQTIAGGIFDALDTRPFSNTLVSAPLAAAAGTRSIA